MIGGNISELKIVVSLTTDKIKQGVASVKGQMSSLKRSVQATSSSITPSFDRASASVANISMEANKASLAMKAFGQGGASIANTLSIALGKISPKFNQMREGISAVGNSMKGLGTTSKLAMAAVAGAIAGIAIVAVVKIFKAMYNKMDELVSFAAPAEYKKAVEPMQQSIDKLKTSIGTALVPMFSILSNAIKVVADGLTWFVENIVAPYYGFIAQMFGWMSAFDTSGISDVSDTMASASDSTGKMAEDVKEMGKGLAGFDKLTTQSKSSESSDDSTSTDSEYERQRDVQAYEKVKTSMKAGAKFAEQVKNFLKPIGEWFGNAKAKIDEINKNITKGITKAFNKVKKIWKRIDSKVKAFNNMINDGIMTAINWLASGLQNVWNWIVNTATNVWNNISSVFSEVWGFLSGLWSKISNGFSTIISTVTGFFGGIWDKLTAGFSSVFENVKSRIMTVVDTFKSLFTNAIDTLKNMFGALFSLDFSGVWNAFLKGFKNVKTIIGNAFGDLFNIDWGGIFSGMKNAFKNVVNAIVDAWNSVVPKLDIGIDIPIINKHVGISTDFLRLPRLARGGLVEPNNPMPVIVGDNTKEKEAIAPISTLEGMIDRSVRNAMSKYDNQQSRQDITLNIDGRKLARITHNYNTMESRRRGATIARSV